MEFRIVDPLYTSLFWAWKVLHVGALVSHECLVCFVSVCESLEAIGWLNDGY